MGHDAARIYLHSHTIKINHSCSANIPVPRGMTMDEHGSNFIKRQTTNLPEGSTKPTEPWIHLEESQVETSLVFKSTWRMVSHKNSIRSCDLKFPRRELSRCFRDPPTACSERQSPHPSESNGRPLAVPFPAEPVSLSSSQVVQSNLQLWMIRFAICPPKKITLLMYTLRVTCIKHIKVACITLQKTNVAMENPPKFHGIYWEKWGEYDPWLRDPGMFSWLVKSGDDLLWSCGPPTAGCLCRRAVRGSWGNDM